MEEHVNVVDEESTDERETPYGLRERDAALLIRVLSILQGHMLGADEAPIGPHIRDGLARAGVLQDATSVGEATALVGDLIQQVRYACGDYDDERPETVAHLTTHHLSMPSSEAAAACLTQISPLGPVTTTTRTTPHGGLDLLVAFPELAPDAAYQARIAQLDEIALRHGGRHSGSSSA
jgi:hypothetical protein